MKHFGDVYSFAAAISASATMTLIDAAVETFTFTCFRATNYSSKKMSQ